MRCGYYYCYLCTHIIFIMYNFFLLLIIIPFRHIRKRLDKNQRKSFRSFVFFVNTLIPSFYWFPFWFNQKNRESNIYVKCSKKTNPFVEVKYYSLLYDHINKLVCKLSSFKHIFSQLLQKAYNKTKNFHALMFVDNGTVYTYSGQIKG